MRGVGAGRRQLEAIGAGATPSFDTVVEPLEACSTGCRAPGRRSATSMPSQQREALRNAYNACPPLPSEYQTDLVQKRSAGTAPTS